VISLLDNTVLSNFTVVQRPDLLRATFGEDLATPQQAYSELQAGIQTGKLVHVDWQWLPVWTLQETEVPHYQQFLQRLNAGEAACLAMALERNCRVLTDDRDAREFARRLQIPLSGTLGVLVRLIDTKQLTVKQGDQLLHEMLAAGYRSPVTSLQAIL
jgi:hypothetical protein